MKDIAWILTAIFSILQLLDIWTTKQSCPSQGVRSAGGFTGRRGRRRSGAGNQKTLKNVASLKELID